METTVGAVKSKILQTDFRVRSENSTIYNISVLQEGRNPFEFKFVYFLWQEYLALI